MLASAATPRRTALAQFFALALLASLTSAAEVRLDFVSSDPAHSIPTAEGWALFGDWPPTKRTPFVTLESLAAVSVTATGGNACSGLSADLHGKSPIVWNAAECGVGLALPTMLHNAGSLPTKLFAMPDDDLTDAVYFTNWGLNRDFDPTVAATVGQIFAAAESWVAQLRALPPAALASSRIEVTVLVAPLVLASEVSGVVKPGHINYYSFDRGSPGAVIITVTPTNAGGNPDLYVNTESSASGALPSKRVAKYAQTSDGDDALTVQLPDGLTALTIGVYGHARSRSEYTLVLSETDSIVPLTSGSPKRFVVPAGEYRYFQAAVPHGDPLAVAVTPLNGAPPTPAPPARRLPPPPPARRRPRLPPPTPHPAAPPQATPTSSSRRTRGRPTRSRRSGRRSTRGRGTSTSRSAPPTPGGARGAPSASSTLVCSRRRRPPSRWWRRGAPTR